MIYEKKTYSWLQLFFFTALTKVSSLAKVSFIFGSYMAFFSAVNIITPLAGAFGGISVSWALFFITLCMKIFIGGLSSLHILAYCVPGLFASLYWSSTSSIIRLLIPQLCIILFIAHPIGSLACPYALYWLIPIALYFFPQQGLFFQALGSTFVAHAVGSVIWLYTMPTIPAMWLALIPVVLVERLFFALGMVLAYRVISIVMHYCTALHTLLLKPKAAE